MTQTQYEALEEEEGEYRKDIVDLKRMVAASEKEGVTLQQKYTHYLEERIRSKERLIDKLEVKNKLLKRKISLSEGLMKSKEGQG